MHVVMWITWITRCFTLALLLIEPHSLGQRCKMPEDWRGRYFQSGIGEMHIRETRITTKGSCIEQRRNYFLFYSRDTGCYLCLMILRRSVNVIQYRETYCSAPGTLDDVCSRLNHKSAYYTMVKDDAEPMRCPFSDDVSYAFNYNDQTYGFCARSTSHLRPCVNQTRHQFHFHHCVALATFNRREFGMECLASWKEDSDTYFYARLPGVDYEEYRCFKYEQSGENVYAAMSADATCRGLRTARDGQFLMEFSPDSYDWPQPSCQFPDWLRDATWRDVTGRWQYVADQHGHVIYAYFRATRHDQPQLISKFRCIRTLDFYILEEEFIFLSFSTHECTSSFQCLKMRKQTQHMVQFYPGGFMKHWTRSRCFSDTDYDRPTLIIGEERAAAARRTSEPCPVPGVYQLTRATAGCVYHVDVGCQNISLIHVESAAICSSSSSSSHSSAFTARFATMQCKLAWKSGTTVHIIARNSDDDSFNCFHLREDEAGTVTTFLKDESCNFIIHQHHRHRHPDTFSVLKHEPCPGKWSTVVQTYSPHYHHDTQLVSDDDTATSVQRQSDLYSHDDDDDDEAGSSGAAQPTAVRGRYGRRYNPPDTVVVVERPISTERTQSRGPQASATTSSAARHLGLHIAGVLWLLIVARTTAFCHC